MLKFMILIFTFIFSANSQKECLNDQQLSQFHFISNQQKISKHKTEICSQIYTKYQQCATTESVKQTTKQNHELLIFSEKMINQEIFHLIKSIGKKLTSIVNYFEKYKQDFGSKFGKPISDEHFF